MELVARLAREQVIAAEEREVPEEERGAPARGSGDRDREEIVIEGRRLGAVEGHLDRARVGRDVVRVNHARAPEALRELRVVGDVVAMGEEHPAHSAQRFDPVEEPGQGTW